MSDSMPGAEQIITDDAPVELYCGNCMVKMKKVDGNTFQCPLCGTNHKK